MRTGRRGSSFIRAALVLCALAPVPACNDDPLDGGAGGPIPIDRIAGELQTARCSVLVACGEMPDMATCMSIYPLDRTDLPGKLAAAKAGRVLYDADQARACIDAYAKLGRGCSYFGWRGADLGDPQACGTVFKGTFADGAACVVSAECKSEWCILNDSSCDFRKTCCAMHCAMTIARVAVGGDCTFAPCIDGAWCKDDMAAKTRTCQARIAQGGRCTSASEGQCASGLYCVGAGAAPGWCGTLPGADQPCSTWESPCDRWDNYCNATTLTCTKVVGIGAACIGARCAGHAFCDYSTNRCKARSKIAEFCMPDKQPCLRGLSCIDNVCTLPHPILDCST